jgi:hypothetical protein
MTNTENVLLHDQDIAIKRYPCHLGMHWGIDAALRTRDAAFAIGAPANDAAIAIACRHFQDPNPSNFAEAAALPITPTIDGGCNLKN